MTSQIVIDGTQQHQQQQPYSAHDQASSADIPRPKRIACIICRKRKLRCDGTRPSCGTCSRLGHDCGYDEIRRKSGPKRGYVKALEARLAQVETLLKNKEGSATTPAGTNHPASSLQSPNIDSTTHTSDNTNPLPSPQYEGNRNKESVPRKPHNNSDDSLNFDNNPLSHCINNARVVEDITVGWDIMSLGVEEPLPDPEIQDALHKVFFEKAYPSSPILHKTRYLQNLKLLPHMQPPTCLRYAIWTLAASISDEYFHLQTQFYRMARKYVEDTELKGHGEQLVNVAMAQSWIFIACYEFRLMYFPRAWMSTGRAVRLCQMMGLHRLDGSGLDVKQCLPPPKDWTEREERRRTFWMAFCIDRYASSGTGWPMTIEEKDIMTNLPASEDSFEQGRPSRSLTLKEAMTPDGARHLSPYAGVVLMACLFGRNLIHLHRPGENDEDENLNGEFWRRHRHMDNILLNIALSLPSQFKLPNGIDNPNIVFLNMNIHTATICLHQAALFKAERNNMPLAVSSESHTRCLTAAAQIASIMKMVAHMDITGMNPFLCFCLYVASRIFVDRLKSRPRDESTRASLEFLLTAMRHMKKKAPLMESFLVQLEVDSAGMLDNPTGHSKFPFGLKRGEAEIYVQPSERWTPDSGMHETNAPHQVQEFSDSGYGSSAFTTFCPNNTNLMEDIARRQKEGRGGEENKKSSQQSYVPCTYTESSPSNFMEAPEFASSGLTPASSTESATPHQTPSSYSSNSFSPMERSINEPMVVSYQNMTTFQQSEMTAMSSRMPFSPGKQSPWSMIDFDGTNPELHTGVNVYDLYQTATSYIP